MRNGAVCTASFFEKDMKTYTIDVVIPTFRPDRRFVRLLEKLGEQTRPAGRVIVINTGRENWEKADFEKEPFQEGKLKNGSVLEVYHIPEKSFDHAGTRAMAAAKSSADLILFMTQDALPADESLIEQLVRVWERKEEGLGGRKIGAAYARQLPASDCRFLERYTRGFNYPEESRIKSEGDMPELGIKTFFCSNVCAVYRREIYEKMGGFASPAIFNEDMVMAGKMIKEGYLIAYEAEARVIHSHNYTGLQQFHRNFDMAVSQADHPEIFQGISSESEGIRLVRRTAGYLIRSGKAWMLPELIWQSGWKYLGYRLGRNYRSLPAFVIEKCTMNRNYWKNKHF